MRKRPETTVVSIADREGDIHEWFQHAEKTAECKQAAYIVRANKFMDVLILLSNQEESLAALNRGVEACIAVCPEQYQWEYKRFKKFPLPGKDPYKI